MFNYLSTTFSPKNNTYFQLTSILKKMLSIDINERFDFESLSIK